MDDAALLDRWRAAAPPGSDALARELLSRWREPHRHYHTVAHLAAMLHRPGVAGRGAGGLVPRRGQN